MVPKKVVTIVSSCARTCGQAHQLAMLVVKAVLSCIIIAAVGRMVYVYIDQVNTALDYSIVDNWHV